MDDRASQPRKPGRPAAGSTDSVRDALLAAAREHFTRRDFRSVSVRELAAAAGVNAAMVNYYFEDKAGLYLAMLEEAAGPLLEALESDDDLSLSEFFENYVRILAANPWLPNLVVREVLYGDAEQFRDTFVRRFSRRIGTYLPRMVAAERDAGRLRPDLDADMTALSMLSLAVFPFIARPLVGDVLDVPEGEAFVELLIHHTQRLLFRGTLAPGQEPPPHEEQA